MPPFDLRVCVLHAAFWFAFVAGHVAARALMYGGVGRAVFGGRMPVTPSWLGAAGALVIFAGGVLAGAARLAFAS